MWLPGEGPHPTPRHAPPPQGHKIAETMKLSLTRSSRKSSPNPSCPNVSTPQKKHTPPPQPHSRVTPCAPMCGPKDFLFQAGHGRAWEGSGGTADLRSAEHLQQVAQQAEACDIRCSRGACFLHSCHCALAALLHACQRPCTITPHPQPRHVV